MTSRLTEQRILEAETFFDELNRLVNGTNFSAKDWNRTRAAGAAFGIAQSHHHAIVFLLKNTFYSSSMALLRSVFEAYLRGLWLKHCATDVQVENHLMGRKRFPDNSILMAAIEALPQFGAETLSLVKTNGAWDDMCDFAHTGGLHLQRWQSKNGIEPNFDPEELEVCLTYAELYAAMSGLEAIQMSEDGNNGEAIVRLIEKRWPPRVKV